MTPRPHPRPAYTPEATPSATVEPHQGLQAPGSDDFHHRDGSVVAESGV